MFVYLIQEDGESKCWKARTPQDAIAAAVKAFCQETEASGDWDSDELPFDYWMRAVFESCALVGELANP
jgi:hypothetical protein